MTDKHLHDSNYPQKALDEEIDSIFDRSIYLTKRLLELSKDVHCFKITEASFAQYVENRYLKKVSGSLPAWAYRNADIQPQISDGRGISHN